MNESVEAACCMRRSRKYSNAEMLKKAIMKLERAMFDWNAGLTDIRGIVKKVGEKCEEWVGLQKRRKQKGMNET